MERRVARSAWFESANWKASRELDRLIESGLATGHIHEARLVIIVIERGGECAPAERRDFGGAASGSGPLIDSGPMIAAGAGSVGFKVRPSRRM